MPTPEQELEAYRKNADALIKARTEQLRDAVGKIEKLADAMRAAIGASDFDTAKDLLRTVIRERSAKAVSRSVWRRARYAYARS